MEPRLGHDFSRVRVHTDAAAAEAAAAVGARAFTANGHIVFGAGEYAPQTGSGRQLLSHELTHVTQQRAGVPLMNGVGRPDDIYERHADATARLLVDGPERPALASAPVSAASGSSAGTRVVTDSASPLQLQMQKAAASTPSTANDDARGELLAKTFEKLLKAEELKKKVNGAMARELARAYVNRRQITSPEAGLHATTYVLDKAKAGVFEEPSEAEVSAAILSELTMKKGAMGDKLTDWEWRPPEVGTRGGTLEEIAKWAITDLIGIGDFEELVADPSKEVSKGLVKSQSKEISLTLGTQWLEGKGLVQIAEIVTGVKEIIEIRERIYSVLELLIQLQKPVKKQVSKEERIVADVRLWLAYEQSAAEAAEKAAQQSREASQAPLFEPFITAQDKAQVRLETLRDHTGQP